MSNTYCRYCRTRQAIERSGGFTLPRCQPCGAYIDLLYAGEIEDERYADTLTAKASQYHIHAVRYRRVLSVVTRARRLHALAQ